MANKVELKMVKLEISQRGGGLLLQYTGKNSRGASELHYTKMKAIHNDMCVRIGGDEGGIMISHDKIVIVSVERKDGIYTIKMGRKDGASYLKDLLRLPKIKLEPEGDNLWVVSFKDSLKAEVWYREVKGTPLARGSKERKFVSARGKISDVFFRGCQLQ